jgi:hypothetical protein
LKGECKGEADLATDFTQSWGWRIVADTDSDAQEFIDAPLLVFDTTPEFLAWYGSWSDCLNLDDRRGKMLGEGGEDYILERLH